MKRMKWDDPLDTDIEQIQAALGNRAQVMRVVGRAEVGGHVVWCAYIKGALFVVSSSGRMERVYNMNSAAGAVDRVARS